MFRKYWKLLALVGAEVLLLGILVGCDAKEPGISERTEPVGQLRIAGSSSMEKLADVLAERFMDRYPQVTVTVQYTGSSAGITAVLEESADIGLSSRELSAEEQSRGAYARAIAMDGITVCVDRTNTITELTKSQLTDIYTGRITNWSEVGGMNVPIVVVGREAGSGTRTAFEELLGVRDQCTYANEMDGTGGVMARVAATPGAIGYISFDVRKDSVSVLALDGIAPTSENILSGNYTLCRSLLMVTRGEETAWNELVRTWFDFVYSEEGRDAAAKAGFIMAQ